MPYSDRIESLPGMPGMQGSRRIPGGIATFSNAGGQLPQINSLAIGTASPNAIYAVVVNGIVASYAAKASDTAATIQNELLELLNLLGLGVRATASGTNILITGYPGETVDISASGGGVGFALTQTQAATTSAPIGFGLAVSRLDTDRENIARLPTSNSQKFLGITLHSHKGMEWAIGQERGGNASYKQNEPMPVVQMGSLWVKPEVRATLDSKVYARTQVSGVFAELGRLTAVPGTGVTEIVGARWITGGNDIAEVLLNGTETFAP